MLYKTKRNRNNVLTLSHVVCHCSLISVFTAALKCERIWPEKFSYRKATKFIAQKFYWNVIKHKRSSLCGSFSCHSNGSTCFGIKSQILWLNFSLRPKKSDVQVLSKTCCCFFCLLKFFIYLSKYSVGMTTKVHFLLHFIF